MIPPRGPILVIDPNGTVSGSSGTDAMNEDQGHRGGRQTIEIPPTFEPTPAIDALRKTDLVYRVVRTERARSAEESAALQGIPLGALLRTIVVRRGEDDYLFVLVPAGRRFDWPKLRAHLGVRRLTLPDADEARAVTGYERYTITPFGSTRTWPVVVDAAAMVHTLVAIGGGGFGVNVHLAPDELIRGLRADVADVSEAETSTG
jgi:Cys-tRNA(Pro) deacylase